MLFSFSNCVIRLAMVDCRFCKSSTHTHTFISPQTHKHTDTHTHSHTHRHTDTDTTHNTNRDFEVCAGCLVCRLCKFCLCNAEASDGAAHLFLLFVRQRCICWWVVCGVSVWLLLLLLLEEKRGAHCNKRVHVCVRVRTLRSPVLYCASAS